MLAPTLRNNLPADIHPKHYYILNADSRPTHLTNLPTDANVDFIIFKDGLKVSSVSSVRTFQPPVDTLEESLRAYGVNTEAYSFLGKFSLGRDRKSLHVANSKFYVKGMWYYILCTGQFQLI